ncbi:MAG: fructose-bisphosphate aldolase class I [Actinomycetota bacterium]|nr:fructose-bisphosphate aldolase class I [Actinomycetota bacterium]
MAVDVNELNAIAHKMVDNGRGLLAADESTGTATKRFEALGIESTEETRRTFRELMVTTPGIEEWIGGVIMYDETVRQEISDGTPFPQYLESKGIVPGVKPDKGAKPLEFSEEEKYTYGLDDLPDRLAEYYELGCRFTKWRTVISIDPDQGLPTRYALRVNAQNQARCAAIAQNAGMVPIVEPETEMKGTHSIQHSFHATREALYHQFSELLEQRVKLEGMLLKTNMVMTGFDADPETRASAEEVAERTLECMYQVVPAAVPAIVFLSGGQSDQEASANLNEMVKRGPHPWVISFSYARALQGVPMEIWGGEDEKIEDAQKAFHYRTRLTAAARVGKYSEDMEADPGDIVSVEERELEALAS